MQGITEKQYWKEIRALAKEADKRVKEGEEPSDVVHEMVDGHQWIIYTHYLPYVLINTRNEEAAFDAYGEVSGDHYSALLTPLAYYAMEQDVYEHMKQGNPRHTRPKKPAKKKRRSGRPKSPYSRARKGGGSRKINPKKKATGVRSLVSKALK